MYAAKKDSNHDEIAQVFDTFGYFTIDTSKCHGILLDIIAYKARSGEVWYIEVKNGKYWKLTENEKAFISAHRERSIILETREQAIEFCQKQAR
jgi:predicted Holliday junction resolvase-like endonuclease